MQNIVIGIEGYVGAGKTSICRELLKRIPNAILFHGGNLYRAIVYSMIKNGDKLEEIESKGKSIDIKDMMDALKIDIKVENQETVVYVDNEKIDEDKLQSKESSLAVSHVGGSADNRKLFEFARKLIDDMKKEHNVIVSGRSLMEIYPNLNYHFMITADLDERVRRKCIQYKDNSLFEEIKKNIIERDTLQEKAGFYKLYDITKVVDVTDCKNVEESTEKLLKEIKI